VQIVVLFHIETGRPALLCRPTSLNTPELGSDVEHTNDVPGLERQPFGAGCSVLIGGATTPRPRRASAAERKACLLALERFAALRRSVAQKSARAGERRRAHQRLRRPRGVASKRGLRRACWRRWRRLDRLAPREPSGGILAVLAPLATGLAAPEARKSAGVCASRPRTLPQSHSPRPGHRQYPCRGLQGRTRPPVAWSALSHPKRSSSRLRSRFGAFFDGWAQGAGSGR